MITIGDLRRAGQGLYCHCVECGRTRTIDPRRIALADDLPVSEAGWKLKCRVCGNRKIYTMPAEETGATWGRGASGPCGGAF